MAAYLSLPLLLQIAVEVLKLNPWSSGLPQGMVNIDGAGSGQAPHATRLVKRNRKCKFKWSGHAQLVVGIVGVRNLNLSLRIPKKKKPRGLH